MSFEQQPYPLPLPWYLERLPPSHKPYKRLPPTSKAGKKALHCPMPLLRGTLSDPTLARSLPTS